mmetsp:Transcript_33612/g.51771  ORF Transcript_33612/g.51771 Transcript_33612/m.51771 type:complete len:126 (-) Transcript_33612:1807-2184(-)
MKKGIHLKEVVLKSQQRQTTKRVLIKVKGQNIKKEPRSPTEGKRKVQIVKNKPRILIQGRNSMAIDKQNYINNGESSHRVSQSSKADTYMGLAKYGPANASANQSTGDLVQQAEHSTGEDKPAQD